MSAAVERPTKKVVPPPTKKELQELEQDYIVLCSDHEVGYSSGGPAMIC